MADGEIAFARSGKAADVESWAIRRGSNEEQRKSAVGLLVSLREDGFLRARVWLDGRPVRVKEEVPDAVL